MRVLDYKNDLTCALGFSYEDTFCRIFELLTPGVESLTIESPEVNFLINSKRYCVYAEGVTVFTQKRIAICYARVDEFDLNYGIEALRKDIENTASHASLSGCNVVHIFIFGSLLASEPREVITTKNVQSLEVVLHILNLNSNVKGVKEVDILFKYLNTGVYTLYKGDNIIDDLERNKVDLLTLLSDFINESLGSVSVDLLACVDNNDDAANHEMEGNPVNDVFHDRCWNSGYGQGRRDMYDELVYKLSKKLEIAEICATLNISEDEVGRVISKFQDSAEE